MKPFAVPSLLLLLACVHAGADVVIEQKTESPQQSGVSRIMIKGNRARIDMPGATGDVTVFLDSPGKMVTYLHPSKVAITTTLTDTQITAKALLKKAGVEPRKQDLLKPTGETEKVGAWHCEIWIRITPSVTQKEWRSKDISNLLRIMEQMKILASVPGMGIQQPEVSDGFTVKAERSDAKGTSTVTVTKISEEAVPETDFTPPEGYREVAIPSN